MGGGFRSRFAHDAFGVAGEAWRCVGSWTSDEVKGRSGFRSWFRILKSFYAKRTGRGGRGLEVCRLRPVGHAFGLRAAAAWPRVSVSGRSSAGPADVAVTGYGKICVS